MGRTKNHLLREFFTFNGEKNECKICKTQVSGNFVTNLKRHIDLKHPDIYNSNIVEDYNYKPSTKKIKVTIEVDKDNFVDSFIKIVTKDGCPLSYLDSDGFREIINPIFTGLNLEVISSHNIMQFVNKKLETLITNIKKDCKGRMISLKIDAATRLDRSILGVNVQFINYAAANPKIELKTLGLVQLETQHTGEYLRREILNILKKYDIEEQQIYSITSDNGSNMIKTIEPGDQDNIDLWPLLDSCYLGNVECIVCVAHTLQLAVYDVHKTEYVAIRLENIRKTSKKLRTQVNRNLLRSRNCTIPTTDVVTRWTSTFDMLKSISKLKLFLIDFIEHDIDWEWLENYLIVFAPIKTATLELQRIQLTLGDFYKLWQELILKMEQIMNESDNLLSRSIVNALKKRQIKLLENNDILAAVYLDPRLNLMLTDQQKQISKSYLKNIAMALHNTKKSQGSQDVHSTQSSSASNSMDDFFIKREIEADSSSSLLSEHIERIRREKKRNVNETMEGGKCLEKVFLDIENFEHLHTLSLEKNILEFWHAQKYSTQELFQIALLVHGVPATQISVERAFSSLDFILSDLRYKVSPETLQSLLLVKLNLE